MKLINEVLKETTDQNQPLDIYISRTHDDGTPEDFPDDIDDLPTITHKFKTYLEGGETK